MRTIYILYLLLFFTLSQAQKLNWVQEHPLVEQGFHWGNAVSADNRGNVYSVSIYRDNNGYGASKNGSYIRKYNQQGDLLWEKFKLKAEIYNITNDMEGNIYLSGSFAFGLDFGCGELYTSSGRRYFLTKLDTSGNCLWTKEFKSAWVGRIIADKNSEALYIIGGGNGYYHNFGCASFQKQYYQYVAKYDANTGECIWLQPIFNDDYITDLAVSRNYIAITGKFNQTAYFGMDSSVSIGNNQWDYKHNVYTALYDLNGNIKWAKITADYSDDASANSIAIDDSSHVYLAGNYYNKVNLAGKYYQVLQWQDMFVVKYNELGDTLLTSTWPGTSSEDGVAIHVNKNGVYFSGVCYSQVTIADTTIAPNKLSAVLVKLDKSLKKVEWLKTLTNSNAAGCVIRRITTDQENNILVCGDYVTNLTVDTITLTYNNSYYTKPFVASFKELTPLVAIKKNEALNNGFVVYPNPSNGIIVIKSSKEITNGEIRIENVLGQLVYVKKITTNVSGINETIDLSKYPRGIYFVQISSGSGVETRKIILE